MQIKTFAQQANLPPKTIRYYEEIGLLPPPNRLDNGYRDWSDVRDQAVSLRICKPAQDDSKLTRIVLPSFGRMHGLYSFSNVILSPGRDEANGDVTLGEGGGGGGSRSGGCNFSGDPGGGVPVLALSPSAIAVAAINEFVRALAATNGRRRITSKSKWTGPDRERRRRRRISGGRCSTTRRQCNGRR